MYFEILSDVEKTSLGREVLSPHPGDAYRCSTSRRERLAGQRSFGSSVNEWPRQKQHRTGDCTTGDVVMYSRVPEMSLFLRLKPGAPMLRHRERLALCHGRAAGTRRLVLWAVFGCKTGSDDLKGARDELGTMLSG